MSRLSRTAINAGLESIVRLILEDYFETQSGQPGVAIAAERLLSQLDELSASLPIDFAELTPSDEEWAEEDNYPAVLHRTFATGILTRALVSGAAEIRDESGSNISEYLVQRYTAEDDFGVTTGERFATSADRVFWEYCYTTPH